MRDLLPTAIGDIDAPNFFNAAVAPIEQNGFSIRHPNRVAIIRRSLGQWTLLAAVRIHQIGAVIHVAVRLKCDLTTIGAPRWSHVSGRIGGELDDGAAVWEAP